MPPLIPEMLSDAHGRPCAAATHQRGLIRGCGDNNGTLHALGSKDGFNEFPQLAPALTNERENNDIGLHVSPQVAQQIRFPHARSREKPKTLASGYGKKGIEDRHARFQTLAQHTASGRSRRVGFQRPGCCPSNQWPAIQRLAERIDNSPDPGIAWRDSPGLAERDPVPEHNSRWLVIRENRD